MAKGRIHLGIDVESLFHGHPMYENLSSPRRREADGGYLRKSLEILMALLDKYGARVTFFILGEVETWLREEIVALTSTGHEIGLHAYEHRIIATHDDLTAQLGKAENFIRRYRPQGFRGPWFRMPSQATELLVDAGFRYLSSSYSCARLEPGRPLADIPVSLYPWPWHRRGDNAEKRFEQGLNVDILLHGLPSGSGMFWGLPLRVITTVIDRSIRLGMPVILTLHPWQLHRPRYQYFLSRSFLVSHPWWGLYAVKATAKLEYLLENYDIRPLNCLLDTSGCTIETA